MGGAEVVETLRIREPLVLRHGFGRAEPGGALGLVEGALGEAGDDPLQAGRRGRSRQPFEGVDPEPHETVDQVVLPRPVGVREGGEEGFVDVPVLVRVAFEEPAAEVVAHPGDAREAGVEALGHG